MPALSLASLQGPVDQVFKSYNKRQTGTPGPAARIDLPMANSGNVQLEDPILDEALEGDADLDSLGSLLDLPADLPILPILPITVTVINTLPKPDATPTLSIPTPVNITVLPTNTISKVVAQPSSVSVVRPSGVIVAPSSAINGNIPKPSIPAAPLPIPSSPQSQPPGRSASSVLPSPSAGAVLTENSRPIASGNLSNTNKLPTGAIIGIVVGIAVVLLLGGMFVARKTLLRRRRRDPPDNEMSWPEEKPYTIFGPRFMRREKRATITPYPFTGPVSTAASNPVHHQPQMNIPRIPPPPITPSMAPPHLSSTAPRPPVPLPPRNNGIMPPPPVPRGTYTVKSTFVTTRSDELSLKMGEKIRVLTEYDDGWAFCEKVATEDQGMVPMECLAADRGVGRAGNLRIVV